MPSGNIVNLNMVKRSSQGAGNYLPTNLSTVTKDELLDTVVQTVTQVASSTPGMKTQIGTVVFSAVQDTLSSMMNKQIPGFSTGGRSGWTSDNFDIPEAYKVKIYSTYLGRRGQQAIIALLQDKVSFNVTSDWEPLIGSIPGFDQINAGLQVITGGTASAVTSITSRRIWKGTSPIKITLPLRFEAVRDALREVVYPCLNLKKIALPNRTPIPFQIGGVSIGQLIDRNNLESFVTLAPPGPSPFPEIQQYGDQITIQIGTLWKFDSVIIKEVNVDFSTKYTSEGYPISADVNLIFETYEIMIKEQLDNVYQVGVAGA